MQCTQINSGREDKSAKFEINFKNGTGDYSTKVHDLKMKLSNVREKAILKSFLFVTS